MTGEQSFNSSLPSLRDLLHCRVLLAQLSTRTRDRLVSNTPGESKRWLGHGRRDGRRAEGQDSGGLAGENKRRKGESRSRTLFGVLKTEIDFLLVTESCRGEGERQHQVSEWNHGRARDELGCWYH